MNEFFVCVVEGFGIFYMMSQFLDSQRSNSGRHVDDGNSNHVLVLRLKGVGGLVGGWEV